LKNKIVAGILILFIVFSLRCFPIATAPSSNPIIVAACWWISHAVEGHELPYCTVENWQSGLATLKSMNFNTVSAADEDLVFGRYDSNLTQYNITSFLGYARKARMKVIVLLAGCDNIMPPTPEHLTAIKPLFEQYSDVIIGVLYDDCVTSLYGMKTNPEDLTKLTREYLGWNGLIEFDDIFSYIPKANETNTVSEGYAYVDTYGSFALTDSWLQSIYDDANENYPEHSLGVMLDAWNMSFEDWNPAEHLAQINKALSLNFTSYEYYAWECGFEADGICTQPQYFSQIAANNQYILNKTCQQQPQIIMSGGGRGGSIFTR
jgi:hypothetical protein